MKISIVTKRPYVYQDADGRKVSEFAYGGFTEAGKVVVFTSSRDHQDSFATDFDPETAIEVTLTVKTWDGKMKFREV